MNDTLDASALGEDQEELEEEAQEEVDNVLHELTDGKCLASLTQVNLDKQSRPASCPRSPSPNRRPTPKTRISNKCRPNSIACCEASRSRDTRKMDTVSN